LCLIIIAEPFPFVKGEKKDFVFCCF